MWNRIHGTISSVFLGLRVQAMVEPAVPGGTTRGNTVETTGSRKALWKLPSSAAMEPGGFKLSSSGLFRWHSGAFPERIILLGHLAGRDIVGDGGEPDAAQFRAFFTGTDTDFMRAFGKVQGWASHP